MICYEYSNSECKIILFRERCRCRLLRTCSPLSPCNFSNNYNNITNESVARFEKEESDRITVFRRVFLLSESFVDHAVSAIMHGFCGAERRCSGALRPVRRRTERTACMAQGLISSKGEITDFIRSRGSRSLMPRFLMYLHQTSVQSSSPRDLVLPEDSFPQRSFFQIFGDTRLNPNQHPYHTMSHVVQDFLSPATRKKSAETQKG